MHSEPLQLESDAHGEYVELCFPAEMASIILDEQQLNGMQAGEVATLRVYIAQSVKRAVVIKEDDILTKKDLEANSGEVAEATLAELKTWLDNDCLVTCLRKNAQNLMTSRYVSKWKWILTNGQWKKVIRMRLYLRGFMDLER